LVERENFHDGHASGSAGAALVEVYNLNGQ
jgi:hypothetical protein